MVHFQVRPARSVTYWLLPAAPAALLFAFVVTCVPLFPLVFLLARRAARGVLFA